MKERNNRDQVSPFTLPLRPHCRLTVVSKIVLATKYTTGYPSGKGGEKIKTNFQGNHSKSLRHSVDASLKKMQTDYIDLLYLHWWDFSTSVVEVMQSLHHLVQAGKVLYIGVSDTPAWVVSKANQCTYLVP